MPVILIYALIAAGIFGSGYGTCWKVMNKEVATLTAQIEVSNEQARTKLLESIAEKEKAESNAVLLNKQLGEEYAKNMQAVNDNAANLANMRMRVRTVHKDCENGVSGNTSTGISKEETNTTELPGDMAELLRQSIKRADEVAVYANKAYEWAETKCGTMIR
jgi:hypothetical protein